MATGDNLSRILEGGHEPFYDFLCSLCENEGKHMEAVRYCEECFVYMCDRCVRNHNRFPLNTRHQLLNQSQFATVTQSSLVSFPTKRCLKHPGELINIYCENHDVVCCSSCKVLEHSECESSQHLTDAAKGIQKSEEYQYIKNEISALLIDVVGVVSHRQACISRTADEKQRVEKVIADFRIKVSKFFDDLEQQTLDHLNMKAITVSSICEQDINDLTVTKTKAEEILQQLESFKGSNECDLFVQVKTGKQFLYNATEKILQYSKTVQKGEMNFRIDPSIEEKLCSVESLGTFTDPSLDRDSAPPPKYKPRIYRKISVVENSDAKQCDITDACQLPDGTILIVDCNNMKLKRLDKSYKVYDYIQLAQKPVGICSLGFHEIAVSLCDVKKVQCMSVQRELTLITSFRTGGYCRGITHADGKLYVCCGDLRDTSSGCIEVYNTAGKLQFNISPALSGLSSIPVRIIATNDGRNLIVTCWKSSNIKMLDLTGKEVKAFCGDLKGPTGLSKDNKDQVFVCGSFRNTIVQLSPRHLKTEVIMKEDGGIKGPYTICYDRKQTRLLISCFNSDDLFIFNLK